jgi:transketolase
MVDKSTARALVYGALGTLALVLVIAIYAIATKGSVQAELDEQLAHLALKAEKLRQAEERRDAADRKFKEAQESLSEKERRAQEFEQQRDHYREEFAGANKRAEHNDNEANLLRRRLYDKDDQAKMIELEAMDEEQLKKDLEEEGEKFFKDFDDLKGEVCVCLLCFCFLLSVVLSLCIGPR